MNRSILESSGVRQIVAALTVHDGFSSEVFNRFRSQGVAFKTDNAWDEVKALYRGYPIDTRGGIRYCLQIRTNRPLLGATETPHILEAIPAIYVQSLNSEGYLQRDGLVTSDGSVLKTIPNKSTGRYRFSQHEMQGPVGSSVGLSWLETRRIVQSYRREVALRIQEEPSVRYSDAEARGFMGQMLEIWKQNSSPAAR